MKSTTTTTCDITDRWIGEALTFFNTGGAVSRHSSVTTKPCNVSTLRAMRPNSSESKELIVKAAGPFDKQSNEYCIEISKPPRAVQKRLKRFAVAWAEGHNFTTRAVGWVGPDKFSSPGFTEDILNEVQMENVWSCQEKTTSKSEHLKISHQIEMMMPVWSCPKNVTENTGTAKRRSTDKFHSCDSTDIWIVTYHEMNCSTKFNVPEKNFQRIEHPSNHCREIESSKSKLKFWNENDKQQIETRSSGAFRVTELPQGDTNHIPTTTRPTQCSA